MSSLALLVQLSTCPEMWSSPGFFLAVTAKLLDEIEAAR